MNRWSSKFYVPDLIELKEKVMSSDRCTQCEAVLDTDAYPESYREDFDNQCLCEDCYAGMLEASTYICPQCSGSGEGLYEGTLCSACKGAGEIDLNAPTREDYEADRADALNDERLLARGD